MLVHHPIDGQTICFHFVPMAVEFLGEAYDLGWRVTVRCAEVLKKALGKLVRSYPCQIFLPLPQSYPVGENVLTSPATPNLLFPSAL